MIELLRAGVFDSSPIFKSCEKTSERITSCYEIELYIEGYGETYIDSVSYPHEKDNLIFARPNQRRCSKNKFICLYVHLNMDELSASALENVCTVTKAHAASALTLCFTDIIRLYEASPKANHLQLQSRLYKLLDLIGKTSEQNSRIKKSGSKITPDIIQKAIDFIEENLQSRLSLKDIAQSVNFSPSYFHKLFTSYTGKTPHDFLTLKRLEAAKLYLLTTDLSVDDIVDKCGFSSLSYFDYCFKAAYKITPSEFRKRKYTM